MEPLRDDEREALSRMFSDRESATRLLDEAGLPRHQLPTWSVQTAAQFWHEVSSMLGDGVLVDGRQRVRTAVARRYPANPVFSDGDVTPADQSGVPAALTSGVTADVTSMRGTARGWDALDLGVHRAIRLDLVAGTPVPTTTGVVARERLTTYVVREHDVAVRKLLTSAVDGAAVLALLVGGSCTGKTRAMYEAIRECMPTWPLFVPRDAGELCRWLDSDALTPESVLWLDDAQRFLPVAAAHLGHALRRARRCAVVGTLWPQQWIRFLAHSDGGSRPAPLRVLLERHGRIQVARFNEESLRRARELSRHDTQLAAAVRAARHDYRVIEHLTGGPTLVEFFDNADSGFFTPLEHAIVATVLDLRRLGHDGAIPRALLVEAAAATLPSEHRVSEDPGRLDGVLNDLCHAARLRVHGALSPLVPVREAAGFGPADGYHPADYLDQHTRETRRSHVPGAAFWDAVVRHVRTCDDQLAMAEAAENRWRLRHAAMLYRRAAEAGSVDALWSLALLRQRAGDNVEAEALAAQALALDGPDHLWHFAQKRQWAGDSFGAEWLALLAANAGDTDALWCVARARLEDGDDEGAAAVYRRGVDFGDDEALLPLAWLTERAGDVDQAVAIYRRAAVEGHAEATWHLARIREEAGDPEGAEGLVEQAAAAGEPWASWSLAIKRARKGDSAGAEKLLWTAVAANHPTALRELAKLREKSGDQKGAVDLREQYAQLHPETPGHTNFWLPPWRWYKDEDLLVPPNPHDPEYRLASAQSAVRRLEEAGNHDEAEARSLWAAAQGFGSVLTGLVLLREKRSGARAAEALAARFSAADYPWVLGELALSRDRDGDSVTSYRLARQAADAGYSWALRDLAVSRQADSEADRVARFGVEPDGRPSAPW